MKNLKVLALMACLFVLGACNNDESSEKVNATKQEQTTKVIKEKVKQNKEVQVEQGTENVSSVEIDEAPEEDLITHQKVETISDIVEYFKVFGYQVGDLYEMNPDIIDAKERVRVRIDGIDVIISIYEPANKGENIYLDEIKETGELMNHQATINGNFVLSDYRYHPDKESLISIFKSINEGIKN